MFCVDHLRTGLPTSHLRQPVSTCKGSSDQTLSSDEAKLHVGFLKARHFNSLNVLHAFPF